MDFCKYQISIPLTKTNYNNIYGVVDFYKYKNKIDYAMRRGYGGGDGDGFSEGYGEVTIYGNCNGTGYGNGDAVGEGRGFGSGYD